jgi:hypothetical protein
MNLKLPVAFQIQNVQVPNRSIKMYREVWSSKVVMELKKWLPGRSSAVCKYVQEETFIRGGTVSNWTSRRLLTNNRWDDRGKI